MSIQKVISLLLILFTLYAALDFGAHHLFIMSSFTQLEHDETFKNMERAMKAINPEIHLLGTKTND
jgi:sensor domain CHASE-containing protein